MSEYQYYEFLAVERPLDVMALAEVRRSSSRATITPTTFVSDYNFGGFRGDKLEFMRKHYDFHVYVTNWGTHRLMVRLPVEAVDVMAMKAYELEEAVDLHVDQQWAILELTADQDGGDWEEGSEYMAPLVPIREGLLQGDLRALYLGWLSAVSCGRVEEDAIEPPVPPGLGRLDASLAALAEYLWVDETLLAAAAEASAARGQTADEGANVAAWLQSLNAAQQTRWLERLITGEGSAELTALRVEYRQWMRRHATQPVVHAAGTRTAAQLLERAEVLERERTMGKSPRRKS